VNPQGLIPVVMGLVLVSLGVSGKYKDAWAVITGQGASGAPTRAA